MPWCPQCDEMFPEGPTCPRCSAPLMDEGAERSSEFQQAKLLPQLKVPRRYRRAFDRLGRPKTQSRSLVALATACLLFVGGFFLGRMGSMLPDQPVIRTQPVRPLAPLEVSGSVEYVASPQGSSRDLTLYTHDLASGTVDPVARLPLLFEGRRPSATRMASMGDSVAVVLGDGRGLSLVGLFPAERPPLLWLEGIDAAWESADRVLVLGPQGDVQRWNFAEAPRPEAVPGVWTGIFQSPEGSVLLSRLDGVDALVTSAPDGQRPTITLPPGARVVAVAPGAQLAAVEVAGDLRLWDGSGFVEVHTGGLVPEAGVFAPDGDRLAVMLRPEDGDAPVLGVVDRLGNAALKPISSRIAGGCAALPAWERSGRWVYVAPGDGSIHAVETGGGTVEPVRTGVVGCGLVWIP